MRSDSRISFKKFGETIAVSRGSAVGMAKKDVRVEKSSAHGPWRNMTLIAWRASATSPKRNVP
jgi:hypothetical protein